MPGYKYNLNDIKKIKASEDFLNLDDSVKNCQHEPNDNCTTKSYVARVIQKCDCLPLSMQIPGEEKERLFNYLNSSNRLILGVST